MYNIINKKYISALIVICCLLITMNLNVVNSYAKEIVLQASTNSNSIDAGYQHSVVLMKDGTVWSFGNNNIGQLGNGQEGGSILNSCKPVRVVNLFDIKAVAAGDNYCLALRKDGTVWAWGDNTAYQLGNKSCQRSLTPIQVQGLSDVQSISCGSTNSIALKNDGTVWIWGKGKTFYSPTPEQVQDLIDVKDIDAGKDYFIALKNNGTVWTWGNNAYGQLGDGTIDDRCNPVQVQDITDAKEVAAGGKHSIVLKKDGTVWACGHNQYGQLGDGTTINNNKLVQVQGLMNIEAIDAGYEHSMALKNDGTVWVWGRNEHGELGIGDEKTKNSSIPVKVNLTDVQVIGTSHYHCLVSKDDGTIWAWGYNYGGQLGFGRTSTSYEPVQVINTASINQPSQPQNLIATAGDYEISLSWEGIEGADRYVVKRSTELNSFDTIIDYDITNTSYIDKDVEPGVTYYYVVATVKDGILSDNSNVASAKIDQLNETLELKSIDKIKVEEEITVDVYLNNVNKIYAEDFTVIYDQTIFEYIGCDEIEGLKVVKAINNEGNLRFIIASKGEEKSVDGSEIIVKLKFKAKSSGVSKIDATKARIANIENEWDLEEVNCGETTIIVEGCLDVNRTGEFTLVDLAIDGYYYNLLAENTNTEKYDADITLDGVINDKDLVSIVNEILNNSDYEPNKL